MKRKIVIAHHTVALYLDSRGSPDFLEMTGSTIAECSVSTSYSQSQVNDSVATTELERGMSGGRNGEEKKRWRGWHSLRLSFQLHQE